jgi:hypothetical protein
MLKSLLFLQLFIFSYFCQSQEEVGKISLSLVMPEALEKVDYAQLSKLETKINTLTSNYGIGSSGYNNNFIIYPKFAIYDVSVIEGGMQNITVVTIDFSLFICQSDNNLIFSSITKTLKGSGRDEYSAVNNAIQLIPAKDGDFELFINSGKQKINKYYEDNCDRILSNATSLSKSVNYEEALGILMQVPREVPCYEKIKEKSLEIYMLYLNKKCKSQLSEGDALIANQNYDQALNVLLQIDPISDCFNEAQNRIKSIENKITEQKKDERELEIKKYENEVELEKKRIEAIKEIAVAYYQRTQPTYNYNVLMK